MSTRDRSYGQGHLGKGNLPHAVLDFKYVEEAFAGPESTSKQPQAVGICVGFLTRGRSASLEWNSEGHVHSEGAICMLSLNRGLFLCSLYSSAQSKSGVILGLLRQRNGSLFFIFSRRNCITHLLGPRQ